MCISAVVADTEGHKIELVQHTPKRDKGPINPPETIRMSPKVAAPPHHSISSMYGGHPEMSGRTYDASSSTAYGQGQPTVPPIEHTFERIQFKQATANNGKRRAAQQYYHLLVELWCDIGNNDSPHWVKVAQRKSAKMIVRGRSPGHYQTERRGSASSGPGGGSGALGYGPGMLSGDFSNSSTGSMLGPSSSYGYDPRSGGAYGMGRHHALDLPPEAGISPEDAKRIESAKGLRCYPGTAYEGATPDSQGRVETYPSLPRPDQDAATAVSGASSSVILPHMATGFESGSKVKAEFNGTVSNLCYPGPNYGSTGHCRPFESKNTTTGYYPTILPPSGLNMT